MIPADPWINKVGTNPIPMADYILWYIVYWIYSNQPFPELGKLGTKWHLIEVFLVSAIHPPVFGGCITI